MVTKKVGRKEEARQLPLEHQLQSGGARGLAQGRQHQRSAPPMHPLAPPPKRAKLDHHHKNHEDLISASSGGERQFQPPAAYPSMKHPSQAAKTPSPQQAVSTPVSAKTPLPAALANKGGRAAKTSADPAMQNPFSTSRGLRHFSMKVCEKVEEKGTTTYNEVADEVRLYIIVLLQSKRVCSLVLASCDHCLILY